MVARQKVLQQEAAPPETKAPSTYETQHCANGHHQGTSIKGGNGVTFPDCKGTYKYLFMVVTCMCWCHKLFDEYLGDDVEADDASTEPSTTTADTATPLAVEMAAVSAPVVAATATPDMDARRQLYAKLLRNDRISEQPRALADRFVFGREFDVLDMEPIFGERRARGELEDNVELVCRLWVDGYLPQWPMMDMQTISILVDAQDPPSVGAVHAVLTRWAGSRMCTTAESPFRFVEFTPRVMLLGVAEIKKLHKREKEAHDKGFF